MAEETVGYRPYGGSAPKRRTIYLTEAEELRGSQASIIRGDSFVKHYVNTMDELNKKIIADFIKAGGDMAEINARVDSRRRGEKA